MEHPVLSALAAMDAALDEVAGIDPTYLSVGQRKAALTGSVKVRARAQALELRLLAASDDIAETTGDRSTADWLATRTRDNHGTIRRNTRLAKALDTRWTHVAQAFDDGRLNLAQAHVIADALTALPKDLDADLLVKAEVHLVGQAADFGPREWPGWARGCSPSSRPKWPRRRSTTSCWQTNAAPTPPPGSSSGAAETGRPTSAPGFPTSTPVCSVPSSTRSRHRGGATSTPPSVRPSGPSRTSSPACRSSDSGGSPSSPCWSGSSAVTCQRHAGRATTVAVTIPWETLRREAEAAGVAVTSTGDKLTVGETRRLTCQAGILPFVMGGRSVVLDHGRRKRLFDDHQRAVLDLLHPECTAAGCTMPAGFCHAHHKVPWSKGGNTDLDDGTILCPFHHDRAHDARWVTTYHPNGLTTFHRRQ